MVDGDITLKLLSREEVEKCKDRDLLENMLAEMAGEFPALSRCGIEFTKTWES